MRRSLLAFAACLLLPAAAHAGAKPLDADTPSKTPAGATFTAPKAWTLEQHAKHVVLTPPETNMHVVVVDAGRAPDAKAAVQAAWKEYRPNEHHALKVLAPAGDKEGWDEKATLDYETSPNEHLLLQAVASRSGDNWTVLILDGNEGTFEKRLGAAALVLDSMRPAGYQLESFAGRTPHKLDAARLATLRDFLQTSMKKLRIPGIGYAISQNGQVVYEGGIGVRSLGKPDPVDAHTIFIVASNTKGMGTLMLARLADQGKFTWDEKVTDVYPPFRLGSDETTRHVLMKHLVCACTGLPRKDLEMLFDTRPDTPASTTFTLLAGTEPTSKFGEVFQYSNLMASAAGYIGGHLAHPDMELGAAYDRTMQEQVFDPLGMADTTLNLHQAVARDDHADPAGDTIDGQAAPISEDFNDSFTPYRPAGGAWSSSHDMLRYIDNELTKGVLPNGKRYVSEKNLLARRVANVPIGEYDTYGMGLITMKRWGVTVIYHGGDLAGFHSNIYAITDADVGAVILTNGDNGYALRDQYMRRILELLYDGKPQAEANVEASANRLDSEIAKERPHLTVPPDPAQAEKLAAHYQNAGLGVINVIRSGPDVIFDFGAWRSKVASRKNDDGTISFVTIDPGVAGFPFVMTTHNGKRGLAVHDSQHNYTYDES
jgi:CubicO group peptidase (beta-lactamase class C family)